MTRQLPPSNVAGTRPVSVERIRIPIGWLNSWTSVPASAHLAVTSSASGPGPNPLVRPLGAAVGAMRSTIQSAPDVDHAPAGIVAAAKPSAASTVVEDEALVFFSTYGGMELDDGGQTVKWTRNGAFFPAESCSSPASVCGPAPSSPVP